MALIVPFNGKTPKVADSAFVADNATLIGDVEIGENASVFFGAVLRGDVAPIRIGAGSNVQDNVVIHVDADHPAVVGKDVSIGHLAMIHGCTVKDGALVGMSATVLNGAVVGAGALVSAGAVVLENAQIPERSLAAGVPAKVRRELHPEEDMSENSAKYVELSRRYLDQLH